MEGAPIRLYIHGDDRWRPENEWPLKRTQSREFFLGGAATGREGKLLDAAGPEQTRRVEFDGLATEATIGEPRLVYRTDPLAKEMELTGPLALYLNASSTAPDIDWLVYMVDEAPDGKHRELCKGWLRASHRKTDPKRSTPAQPWHPHLEGEPLKPGTTYEFPIEIWPICNVFKAGHRIRLEIANSDSLVATNGRPHVTIKAKATNIVHEGGSRPSKLVVPVIPR